MRTSKFWGIMESPNTIEWDSVLILLLAVSGVVHLLYKIGYVKKERRGRIIAIVMAVLLALGMLTDIVVMQ